MEAFAVVLGVIVMLVIIVYVSSQIRNNNRSSDAENEDGEDDALFAGIDFDATAPEEPIPLKEMELDFEEGPYTEAVSPKSVQVKEVKTCSNLKYEKVLSTEAKREWIENFVNIKRFISAGWTCLGLLMGFFFGRILGYGADGIMILLILLGGLIGGVLGTNSVGAAMMKAIAAEQSIVNEELLTEILNKLEEGDEK